MAALDDLYHAIKGYIDRGLDQVFERIKSLEEKAPIPGPQGERGLDGAPGAAGERGEVGPVGPQGSQGVAGERGLDGAPGAVGERGEVGPVGPQGPQGVAGERGLDGVPGAAGERGEVGPKGDQGVSGVAGRDGRDGMPGAVGERGEKGAKGDQGDRGPQGPQGDIGLGFDDLDFEFDGERTAWLTFSRGDVKKTFTLNFPVPIYRGVFDIKKEYAQCDVVTSGGSQWYATAGKPSGAPGLSDDWVMSVRRGRSAPTQRSQVRLEDKK